MEAVASRTASAHADFTGFFWVYSSCATIFPHALAEVDVQAQQLFWYVRRSYGYGKKCVW
jgi:hypothetical protein